MTITKEVIGQPSSVDKVPVIIYTGDPVGLDATTPTNGDDSARRYIKREPISAIEKGVRISPNNMKIGVPYPFRLEDQFLIAVHRGEHRVEIYEIPPAQTMPK